MENRNSALSTVKEGEALNNFFAKDLRDGKEVRITIDSENTELLASKTQDQANYSEEDLDKKSFSSSTCESSFVDGSLDEVVVGSCRKTNSCSIDSDENEDDLRSSTEDNESEDSFCSNEESTEAESESVNEDAAAVFGSDYRSNLEEIKEDRKYSYPEQASLVDPFSLLNDYDKIDPKDRPTPVDLEAGVYWFVVPVSFSQVNLFYVYSFAS